MDRWDVIIISVAGYVAVKDGKVQGVDIVYPPVSGAQDVGVASVENGG